MKVRELGGTDIVVIERGDDRWFLEDLFALEAEGESIPLLDEDAEDFVLFNAAYRQVHGPNRGSRDE